VFVVDIVEETLANHRVFTHRHTQGVEVASMQYKKDNGIPSSSISDANSP